MFKTKYAFTLAEVLVTLAVVAIISTILMPAIGKARPNKQKVLFKKAYSVAERMVYEIVNDEDLYPQSATTVGLDNTAEIEYLNNNYGSKDNAAEQKSKFCKIFARKVNTTSDTISCAEANSAFTGSPSFITTDGIAWYMPYTDFSTTPQTIRVDVNGTANPNCTYNSSTCVNPDRFKIKVESDGKMYVDGEKEKEYLSTNNTLR